MFQPQYTSASKELKGFEALVRWKSPELGLVSPVKFIPVAEENGLIVRLGEFILRQACKKFKYIQDQCNMTILIQDKYICCTNNGSFICTNGKRCP